MRLQSSKRSLSVPGQSQLATANGPMIEIVLLIKSADADRDRENSGAKNQESTDTILREERMTIRGYDAISAAEELKLPLGKYSEESYRGFRLDLSVEEAYQLASKDQNLIFLELDIPNLSLEQLLKLSAALGAEPGKSCTQVREKFKFEGDDDRAEIFDAIAKRWSELKSASH